MQQSVPNNEQNPIDEHPEHDIFTDPALQRTMVEDPLFRFLKNWWRQLLVIGLAIAAGWYVLHSFQETHIAAMKSSADTFRKVRSAYDELRAFDLQKLQITEPKALTDINQKMNAKELELVSTIDSLSDAKEPYRSFAQLYRALLKGRSGDIEGMKQLMPPDAWKNAATPESPERLVGELAAVAEARLLIDTPQNAEQGKAILKDLVVNGRFVNMSVVKTLSALAQSSSEKEELVTLLEQLRAKRPEQVALIDQALQELGQE